MGRTIESVKQDMARDSSIRRQDKQLRLEESLFTDIKNLQDAIEQTKEEGKEQASSLRTSQIDRLTTLIQRKSDIEAELTTLTTDLAKNYKCAKAEFDVACAGKIGDLEGCEQVLSNLKHDEVGVHGTGEEDGGWVEIGEGNEDVTVGRGGRRGSDGQDFMAKEDGWEGVKAKGKPKGKVDGKATDAHGLIKEVPSKDALKRAEKMAREGKRV